MLASILTSCGNTTSNAPSTSDIQSQVTDNKISPQQVALCYGTKVQDVHAGFYKIDRKDLIKAKSNAACAFGLGNIQISSWITLYRIVNGVSIPVDASKPTLPKSPNGYNEFLQANGPCINGTYYSQVTFRYFGAQTWNDSPASGRSANFPITNC